MADAGETFGELVRVLRRRTGLTQEGLAHRSGLSARGVRNIEAGRGRPHQATIELLVSALATSGAEARRLRQLGMDPDELGPLPAQLPPAHAGFVARTAELAAATAALADVQRQDRPCVVLVHGVAGIGKTAFALQAGHGAAARFPDGTLYAELRGAGRSPAEPWHVQAMLCRALGAPEDSVPADIDERTAYLRSLLARRRVLLVLDDARDADHVAPLLPGAGGCGVLITSRWALTLPAVGLDIRLDPFDESSALALLNDSLGTRLSGAAGAARRIIAACGGLPLALRIAAGRLTLHPSWPLRTYADALGAAENRMNQLRLGDTSVAASLQEVYDALGAGPGGVAVQRLFDRFAVHDGPDLDLHGVARLAEVAPARAEYLLDVLAQAHLVSSPVPLRYTMHDLVRIYGRSHCLEGVERRDLVGSLIVHFAERARDAGSNPAWLAVERPNILATVRAAHAVKPPPVNELMTLLNATGELFDRAQDGLSWRLVAEAVLRAGDATEDDLARAAAHDDLAVISRLGLRLGEAEYHGRLSLAFYTSAGTAGQPRLSRVWNRLGTIYTLRADYREASRCYSTSLALRRAAGDRLGQASVLNNLGLARLEEGDMTAAEDCFRAAGQLYRSLNDLQGEAIACSTSVTYTGDRADIDRRSTPSGRPRSALIRRAAGLRCTTVVRHGRRRTRRRTSDLGR